MLNRRYLRIKALQALYAFFQSDDKDLVKTEKELLKNIDKVYDLYISLILLLVEIRSVGENVLEDAKNKRLPTPEDINPNTDFVKNKFLLQLEANTQLQKEAANRKISWQNEPELIKKIYNSIKSGELYKNHMSSANHSYQAQQDFMANIYFEHIAEFELLTYYFEEKNLFWVDDIDFVNAMVIKTIQSFNEHAGDDFKLMPLFKDEKEDLQFVKDLLRKTILNNDENQKYISEKTRNWEVDRIALMDILLMKMGITELLHFSNIPVKVTLNEYIELSKQYSTPKSKVFINGILDKLVLDFKVNDTMKKSGRGLME